MSKCLILYVLRPIVPMSSFQLVPMTLRPKPSVPMFCFPIRANSYKRHLLTLTREGVQSSSNSNHRHPNLFCGKRAPQLVISTTLNSNHPQKSIKLNRLFLRNKTILTSFNGPMVYNIVKAFFIAP